MQYNPIWLVSTCLRDRRVFQPLAATGLGLPPNILLLLTYIFLRRPDSLRQVDWKSPLPSYDQFLNRTTNTEQIREPWNQTTAMLFTALSPTPQPSSPPYAQYTPARSSPLAPAPTWPMSPSPKRDAHNQPLNLSPTPDFSPTATASRQHQTPQTTAPATHSVSSSRTRTTPTTTYAQRYANTISNPLAAQRHNQRATTRAHPASTSPSSRHKRRTLFLNRIKQERDAGRFENRAERFQLLEHVAERREWGEKMRRWAEEIVQGFGEEEQTGEMDMDMDSERDGIGMWSP